MGGTHKPKHVYSDLTISTVLSVGENDDRSSFPHRLTLSNFNIGTPISSYGGICRKIFNNTPYYLIIRRPSGTSLLEIVRGLYRESQLFFMIQDLSNDDRTLLLTTPFEKLWSETHLGLPPGGEIYEYAKSKFARIAKHFPQLFQSVESSDPQGKNLWLFPKGKPVYNNVSGKLISEAPIECALREFKEETGGMTLSEQDALLSHPVIENFLGSNSKNYQTVYFIFQNNSASMETSDNIFEKTRGEIRDIRWIRIDDLPKFLRPERFQLITDIEKSLESSSPSKLIDDIWKHPTDQDELCIHDPNSEI